MRSTVGVTSLVRFGGQVAEVPLKLIEGLRNAAEEPRAARLMFQQGRRVRIVTGDYATLEAVFDLAEGEERATVLLELLGRQSRVRVGVREIVSADYIDAYLLPFVRALTETASLIAVIAGIFLLFPATAFIFFAVLLVAFIGYKFVIGDIVRRHGHQLLIQYEC